MGRVNKTIEGAFTLMVNGYDGVSMYDKFINYGQELKNKSAQLNKLTENYKKLIKEQSASIQKLADLEIIIMQMRIRENLDSIPLKVTIVRNYIYLRCTFYRKGKEMNDIRVLIGNVKEYGAKVKALQNNDDFMSMARKKLEKTIDDEIQQNIELYKQNYN